MRRKDKEIPERSRLERILAEAQVCRLAMVVEGPDGPAPYVIPVFSVLWNGRLYVHCAREGRKLDLLARNPRVCVEVDECRGFAPTDKPCTYDSVFRSVIAFGTAKPLQDPAARREALDLLTLKYTGRRAGPGFEFSENTLKQTVVLEITLEQITGKQTKDWEEKGGA